MGTDNGVSIQYWYNFEILNTFEMGHLKKIMFKHPVPNGPESDPWVLLPYRDGYCTYVKKGRSILKFGAPNL